jgi:hypothetical protein
MKKKDRQEREFKENPTNLAVIKSWWKFLQSVESIRQDPDNRMAIFWLGTSLQSLIDLSREFGRDRVLEAIPLEQRGLLDTIIADGQDLAATAIKDETRMFGEREFPPSDSVFRLLQELRRAEALRV